MVINGVAVAAPKQGGISVTDETIWASNTGRSSTGKMIGDIVAWKTTIAVTWPPLSFSESKKLRDAIKGAGAFFKIKYYDFSASSMVEKTVYAVNVPRVLYSIAAGQQRHTDITVTFIEQ